MDKRYRIGEAASFLNVSVSRVRGYVNEGRLECLLTPAGQRVFTLKQLKDFLGEPTGEGRAVFYVRDSRGSQASLDSQIVKLKTLDSEPLRIYSDKASGLNENRKGLKALLRDARKGKFDTVCVTNKDRLTRFGYSYIEEALSILNVKIVLYDSQKENSIEDELMQDFMSLIASFSGKFYKLRGIKQQQSLLKQAGTELTERVKNDKL